MIGGDADVAEALRPCWQAMGKTFIRQGGPGAGQHAKLVNQVLIAGNMIGVCEALLYAYKAGLDLETVMQSVASGGGRQLVVVQPRHAHHRQQFRPWLLCRALHQGPGHRPGRGQADATLPARAGPGQSVVSVAGRPGHGRDGTQALQLALAEMSNIDWPNR